SAEKVTWLALKSTTSIVALSSESTAIMSACLLSALVMAFMRTWLPAARTAPWEVTSGLSGWMTCRLRRSASPSNVATPQAPVSKIPDSKGATGSQFFEKFRLREILLCLFMSTPQKKLDPEHFVNSSLLAYLLYTGSAIVMPGHCFGQENHRNV